MSVVTDQHIRESVTIAALAEAGLADCVVAVRPSRGGGWNPSLPAGYEEIAWRVFTLDCMAGGGEVACWDCYRTSPHRFSGYNQVAKRCTHEVRF